VGSSQWTDTEQNLNTIMTVDVDPKGYMTSKFACTLKHTVQPKPKTMGSHYVFNVRALKNFTYLYDKPTNARL